MKLSVLASGSKGNCTYIGTDHVNILIDVGMSCLYIERSLKRLEVSPDEIHGILITHTHLDHINGLRVFLKKHPTHLYISKMIYKDLQKIIDITDYTIVDTAFDIDTLHIDIFKTSHDAPDSNGFIISDSASSLAYITDTGYINRKYHQMLTNKDYYIIESNHDIELLMNGSYPYPLKQRILGDIGHLSNKSTAEYLTKFVGPKTKGIILIHLSEENNRKDIAYSTVKNALIKNNQFVENIIISEQTESTELIQI